jgi:hypothetical protein
VVVTADTLNCKAAVPESPMSLKWTATCIVISGSTIVGASGRITLRTDGWAVWLSIRRNESHFRGGV